MTAARQCNAKSKRTGERCQRPPLVGLQKCYHHAGVSAKANRAAYDLERGARTLLAMQGDPTPVGNPLEELLDLAGEAKAFKDSLGTLVRDLSAVGYGSDRTGEQLKSEVAVYERAMDRLGRLLVDIARLNLDERLVRINEAQAKMMFATLEVVIRKLGLDPWSADIKRLIAAELRKASGHTIETDYAVIEGSPVDVIVRDGLASAKAASAGGPEWKPSPLAAEIITQSLSVYPEYAALRDLDDPDDPDEAA